MLKKIFRYLINYAITKKIIKQIIKNNEGTEIIILGGEPGIGDFLLVTAYLNTYIKNYNQKSIPLCSDTSKNLLEELGIVNYITVNKKQMHEIVFGCCWNPLLRPMIKSYLADGKLRIAAYEYFIHSSQCFRIPEVNILKIIKYSAFQLTDDTAEIRYPKVELDYNVLQKYRIQFPFVIINPYSNSAYIGLDIFEKLVIKIKEKGFNVYCNVMKNQKEVEGSIALRCTIQELFVLSSYAELILSIRSGILDYIVSNAKRIIAIYDREIDYYAYTLKSWETETEIGEFLYDNNGKMLKELEAAIKSMLFDSHKEENE